MRSLLEGYQADGTTVLVFTTQGHTYVGVVSDVRTELVVLTAPDGATPIVLNLADLSGVRPYQEESA